MAPDGEEAVRLARVLRPDIVLMDVRMPRADGLEATRSIASDRDLAATRVLILTTFEIDEYVFEAIRAGASGFLLKDCEPTELSRTRRDWSRPAAREPSGPTSQVLCATSMPRLAELARPASGGGRTCGLAD